MATENQAKAIWTMMGWSWTPSDDPSERKAQDERMEALEAMPFSSASNAIAALKKHAKDEAVRILKIYKVV